MKNLKLILLAGFFAVIATFAPSACASSANAVVGHSAACWISSVSGSTSGMTFQWYKNGAIIPGATGVALPATIPLPSGATIVGNSAYVITTISATDAGVYTCVVSNAVGSTTSYGATLVVVVAPSGAVTATWAN